MLVWELKIKIRANKWNELLMKEMALNAFKVTISMSVKWLYWGWKGDPRKKGLKHQTSKCIWEELKYSLKVMSYGTQSYWTWFSYEVHQYTIELHVQPS